MGYWNYRLVKRIDGYWAIHEVFYNDSGYADGMTVNPIDFTGETKADVICALEMALDDAINRFPFIEPEPDKWPVKEDAPYGKAVERKKDESRQQEPAEASEGDAGC